MRPTHSGFSPRIVTRRIRRRSSALKSVRVQRASIVPHQDVADAPDVLLEMAVSLRPWRNARMSAIASGDWVPRNPTTGIAGCCARRHQRPRDRRATEQRDFGAGEQSRRDIVGGRSSALQRAVSPNPSQKHRNSAPDINVRVRHAHREVARENDRVWITPRDLVQLVVSQRTHFQVLCHRRAPRLLGGKQSHERLHARFGGSKGRQSVICVIE